MTIYDAPPRLGTPETPLLAWMVRSEITHDQAPLRPHAHRAMGIMGNTAMRGAIAACAYPFGLGAMYTSRGEALVKGESVQAIDAVHLHTLDNPEHRRPLSPNTTAEIRVALQHGWEHELEPGFGMAGSGLELPLDETLRSTGYLIIPHPADQQPDLQQYVAEPQSLTVVRL